MPPTAPLIPLGQTILLLYSPNLRLNGASLAFVGNARDIKSLVSSRGCSIERDQRSVESHKPHGDRTHGSESTAHGDSKGGKR
jgi:hypothetical protein